MKKLIKKLEDIMVAITFAEAGEFEEANRMMGSRVNAEQEDGLPQSSVPTFEKAK